MDFLASYGHMYVVIRDRTDELTGYATVVLVEAHQDKKAALKAAGRPPRGYTHVAYRVERIPPPDVAKVAAFIQRRGIQPATAPPRYKAAGKPRAPRQPSGLSGSHYLDEWQKRQDED